jgi:hypothetical protein
VSFTVYFSSSYCYLLIYLLTYCSFISHCHSSPSPGRIQYSAAVANIVDVASCSASSSQKSKDTTAPLPAEFDNEVNKSNTDANDAKSPVCRKICHHLWLKLMLPLKRE